MVLGSKSMFWVMGNPLGQFSGTSCRCQMSRMRCILWNKKHNRLSSSGQNKHFIFDISEWTFFRIEWDVYIVYIYEVQNHIKEEFLTLSQNIWVLGIIWEHFHEPDNVPKWFLITKNLRVETKIMSLVWTEPKLQFHSMRSWASHFCSWHPDHGLWHQSHIYSMFRSWQPQVRISLLEVLLASYSPSTLFLTFWSIWGC